MWSNPESTAGKHFAKHTPIVPHRPSLQCNSRLDQVILSRCRTDTLWLNHRRHKAGKHPTGLCNPCQVKENVEHVLLECPRYEAARRSAFKSIAEEDLSIDTILDSSDPTAWNATLDFLKKAEIIKRLRLEAEEEKVSSRNLV